MSENQSKVTPFEPPMSPQKEYQEINSYVVFWGLFYAAIFALAVGYLCLKIGQTVVCSCFCHGHGYGGHAET
jgi:hypothetical protein